MRNLTARQQEIGGLVNQWLSDDPAKRLKVVRRCISDGGISIALMRMRVQDEIGLTVARPQRADFPGQTARFVLSVATNQATLGWHAAPLLNEQKLAASELDRWVEQRTREQAAANEELRPGRSSRTGHRISSTGNGSSAPV